MFWHLCIGLSLYWLSNLLVVFPWIVSQTLGIIAMILSTLLWGFAAFYCFRHTPGKELNRDMISMAFFFLLPAILQDYFLYVEYRGIPDELYDPTTFLAYGLVFFLPIIIRYLFKKQLEERTVLVISRVKLAVTLIIGIISFFFTIWSIRYW